jgi:regulator of protease activity HflC (stomatin/prohibitin superfamily)
LSLLLIRLFLVLGIVLLLVYFLTIVIVPENSFFIQERLGRFSRTLMPGFYFQIPILDKIAFKFNRKEQVLEIKDLLCQTLDGIPVLIDSIFIFQIQDPIKAAYESENYVTGILLEIQSNILKEIQNHGSDEILARRYGMNQSIVKHTGEAAKNLGLKIVRFEIQQMKRDVKIT